MPYNKSDFTASRDKPEVTIGKNTLRVEKRKGELPIYKIDINEKELGCHLIYRAEVNGWKPGTGLSHFGVVHPCQIRLIMSNSSVMVSYL
ncbi:MAG: hypothetical protein ACW98F_20515 [Candidatus Hodarchaeales archaeon]|jgi:hypothetical protein